jgi:hypothetical protein
MMSSRDPLLPRVSGRTAAAEPLSPAPPGSPAANVAKSPRRKPGDSGWYSFPVAMRRELEPRNHVEPSSIEDGMVYVPGVPGLPPGAC